MLNIGEAFGVVVVIGLGVLFGQWLSKKLLTASPAPNPPPLVTQAQAAPMVRSSGDPVRDFLDNYPG